MRLKWATPALRTRVKPRVRLSSFVNHVTTFRVAFVTCGRHRTSVQRVQFEGLDGVVLILAHKDSYSGHFEAHRHSPVVCLCEG